MSKKRKFVEDGFGHASEFSKNSAGSFTSIPEPVAPSKKYFTRIKDGLENHFSFAKPLVRNSKGIDEVKMISKVNVKKSTDGIVESPCKIPFIGRAKICTRISAYLKTPKVFASSNYNSIRRDAKKGKENSREDSKRCRETQRSPHLSSKESNSTGLESILRPNSVQDDYSKSATTTKWQTLNDLNFLKPLYFDIPNGHDCFIGREWAFAEIEQALKFSGVMAITGGTGTGKTALALQIVKNSCFGRHRLRNSNASVTKIQALAQQLVAFHFCQVDVHSTLLVHEFVHSLAAQLSQAPQFSSYKKFLSNQFLTERTLDLMQCLEDPAKALVKGILEPLGQLHTSGKIQGGPFIILIDSLESADSNEWPMNESISEFLMNNFQYFPNWLKIIITVNESRLDLISKLSPFIVRLDEPRSTVDVMSYVNFRAQATQIMKLEPGPFLDYSPIVTTGNFLCAKTFMDLAENGNLKSIRNLLEFPLKLSALFQLYCETKFQRRRSFEVAIPILSTCLAALSPLTPLEIYHSVNSLDASCGVTWETFLDSFKVLSDILLVKSDGTHTFFHPAFRHWLTHRNVHESGEFLCDTRVGHAAIALRILRVESPLSAEKIFELGYHILKAKMFKTVKTQNFPGHDFLELLLANSGIDFSSALTSTKNLARPDLKVSRLFLSAGANPNATTSIHSNAPLIVANAANMNLNMISLLLDFKADVNAQNKNGETVLHIAAFTGNESLARLLLQYGASMEILDRQGYKCLDKAILSGHIPIIKLFLKRGTKLTLVTWELATGKKDITLVLLHKLLNDGNMMMKKLKLTEATIRYHYAFEKLKLTEKYFNDEPTYKDLELTFLFQLSRCERKSQNLEKAKYYAEEAIKSHPYSSQGYYARARAHQAANENSMALDDVNRAMELSSSAHSHNFESKKQLFRFKEELSRELRSSGFQKLSNKNSLSLRRRRYFL